MPWAVENPEDYTARSNLMWASSMAENRIVKLGKQTDFQAHQIEHQLGAYTDIFTSMVWRSSSVLR